MASVLAVAALAGTGVGSAFSMPTVSATSTQQAGTKGTLKAPSKADRATNIFFGGSGTGFGNQRRAGYGWTNRHQQRVAAKKRNVARNRKAHRA